MSIINCSNCSNCSNIINPTFKYCPFCKFDLGDDIELTLTGIEQLIADPNPFTSSQLSTILTVFKNMINKNPSNCHLLEEKIYYKFIRNISTSEFSVKDMIIIAKKLLELNKLSYSKEY